MFVSRMNKTDFQYCAEHIKKKKKTDMDNDYNTDTLWFFYF